MMNSSQIVETSVTTTDNSPSQDYTHLNDKTTLLHNYLGTGDRYDLFLQERDRDFVRKPVPTIRNLVFLGLINIWFLQHQVATRELSTKSAVVGENFLNIVTSFKFPGSYENLTGLGIENDS